MAVFVENYTNTHWLMHLSHKTEVTSGKLYSNAFLSAFEPQEGTDFIENYNATHSYSLEGDMDALAYELKFIDNNEF